MERFIKALLSHRVHYEQPRLWYTKGQTLRAFLDLPGKLEHHLTNTRSCWQNRRIVNSGGSKKHCGLCAACLLRRQSLHTVAVSETPDAYVVPDLNATDVTEALSGIPRTADWKIMVEYGSVGARHLQHFADMAILPDDKLRVHVSEIATAIYTPGSDLAAQWAKQRRDELDAGRISAIVAALAHHAPTCDEARKCIDYLIRNRKRMRYSAFRARGLCVATGIVEAGCKHAVGARLKRAGMHWSVNGANAILALRCCTLSGRFEAFWERRNAAA